LHARALVIPFLVAILASGSLGAYYARDEVAFDAIERDHFDAIFSVRDTGAPSTAPLVLRLHVMGDAADADTSHAFGWLLANANVKVVRDDGGAPLYLTRLDLAATSGRATLGATIPTGMAVEMGDARLAPCVLAHEILHFVGLTHMSDAKDIMYPQCTRDKLDHATISPAEKAKVDSVKDVRASTTSGAVTWATR
jgi:hypothetical protein